MRYLNLIASIFSLVLLIGCSTPRLTDYSPAPADRLFIAEQKQLERNGAIVEVRRHPGLLGAALHVTVSVDGKDVAVLKPAEVMSFTVATGDHRLSVRWSEDTESFSSIRITAKAGEHLRFGINIAQQPGIFSKAQPYISEQ